MLGRGYFLLFGGRGGGCYVDVFTLVVLGVVPCFACFPSTTGSTDEFGVTLNYLARSACQCGATDCKTTHQVLQAAGWDGLYQGHENHF